MDDNTYYTDEVRSSYGLNRCIGGYDTAYFLPLSKYRRLSAQAWAERSITKPLLADIWARPNGWTFDVFQPMNGTSAGTDWGITARHSEGSNLVWFDGHGTWERESDLYAKKNSAIHPDY